ncbi:MAG TPA: hypothetical protein VFG39_09260 [Balneolaceae bacterium]|nr:hypothetical protein [Balneolaceae bacterium]
MYIRPGMKISISNAPDNLDDLLGRLPSDVELAKNPENESLDLVLGFMENQAMLEKGLPALVRQIKADGALWIAYHKGSSSVQTDINRDSIHKFAETLNLKGVAMVSINDNWSGFRFKKV